MAIHPAIDARSVRGVDTCFGDVVWHAVQTLVDHAVREVGGSDCFGAGAVREKVGVKDNS